MSDPNRTENFTVFGGALPAENRSHNAVPRTPRPGSFVPVAAVLISLVVAAATTTAALAAMKRANCEGQSFYLGGLSETSGGYVPREMLW
jgi:hypothetical protein